MGKLGQKSKTRKNWLKVPWEHGEAPREFGVQRMPRGATHLLAAACGFGSESPASRGREENRSN